jgi:ribosomal-protein-alanine acetyltransferase
MSSARNKVSSVGNEGAAAVTLEPMIWSHSDEVVAIEQQCFGADAWSAQAFWDELGGVPHAKHYVVALAAGAVIGYAGLQFIAPDSEILTVAVRPESRGEGIGRLLVGNLEAAALAHKCATVHLEVEDSNAAARGMYASMGYREIGLRRGYYGAGRDAVLMAKQIHESATNVVDVCDGGESHGH